MKRCVVCMRERRQLLHEDIEELASAAAPPPSPSSYREISAERGKRHPSQAHSSEDNTMTSLWVGLSAAGTNTMCIAEYTRGAQSHTPLSVAPPLKSEENKKEEGYKLPRMGCYCGAVQPSYSLPDAARLQCSTTTRDDMYAPRNDVHEPTRHVNPPAQIHS